MSEIEKPRHLGRSVLAILAGFVVVLVLSLGTDMALHAVGLYPQLAEPMAGSLLIIATIYRTVYGVVGSYVTARFAPARPMLHSLVGGAIGLVLSIAAAVSTWNRVPSLGPHWYPVTLILLAMPGAWAGAKLYLLQAGNKVVRPPLNIAFHPL
jgi:hypothetical protein